MDVYIDRCRRLGHAIAIANQLDYFYEDGVQADLAWDANPLRCAARTSPPLLSVGDWQGNLLMQGTSVYTWDAANRLVGANVNGVVSAYEYDGLSNRVAQTVGGVTTEYVLDVAGGPSASLTCPSWPAWRSQDGQVGSVRTETDTLGRMTTSCSFNPFGVPLGADGSSFNDEVHTALSR